MRLEDGERFFEGIRRVLRDRPAVLTAAADSKRVPAGVLVPLFSEEGVCKVLLTERSNQVLHHKGQISFPGGRVEPSDRDLAGTVLREVREEIGLPPDKVDLLGRIDDALTVSSNYVIQALVGRIPYPWRFKLAVSEVERLIPVPLSAFLSAHPASKRQPMTLDGQMIPPPIYEFGGGIIWGATARILQNLMEILTGSLPLSEMEK